MTLLPDFATRWHAVQMVSVCDERPAARAALKRIIPDAVRSVSDVRCSSDTVELLAQYASAPTDLVLIGVRHARSGGCDAVTALLARHPLAPIIVYGAVTDGVPLAAAIGQGARGFLIWDADYSSVTPARQCATRSLAGSVIVEPYRTLPRLTDRELQILGGMTNGLSNGEIGRTLFVSEDTIKTHARSMYHKLGAHDRAHAVALGLRHELVA